MPWRRVSARTVSGILGRPALVANPATIEQPLNETPNAMALIFNRAVTLTGQFAEAGHFGLAHDANPGTTDVNEVRAMPDRTV
jgi:hypothetical protein